MHVVRALVDQMQVESVEPFVGDEHLYRLQHARETMQRALRRAEGVDDAPARARAQVLQLPYDAAPHDDPARRHSEKTAAITSATTARDSSR